MLLMSFQLFMFSYIPVLMFCCKKSLSVAAITCVSGGHCDECGSQTFSGGAYVSSCALI